MVEIGDFRVLCARFIYAMGSSPNSWLLLPIRVAAGDLWTLKMKVLTFLTLVTFPTISHGPPLRPGDATEGRYANAPPPSSLFGLVFASDLLFSLIL